MLTAATLLLVLDVAAAARAAVPPAEAPAQASAEAAEVAAAAAEVSEDQVDLSGLEPLDPVMRAELSAKLRVAIAKAAAAHEVPAQKLRVAVGWTDVAKFDYRLRLSIEAHDGMRAHTDARSTGADTDDSALGGVVEAALDRLLVDWEREKKALEAVLRRPPTIVTPPPDSDLEDETVRARKAPLGAMGWAGVALMVAGAAGVGAGVGLFALDTSEHPTEPTKLRDWQGGAIAFSVAGGAAMIAGAALVGVDATRRTDDRTLRVAPSAGRTGGGLSLSGRF